MTPSPNTPLSAENVGLLKAGDWLQCAKEIAGPDVRKYVGDLVQFEKIEHGLIGVCGDFWGPSAFTYIGPDLGDGFIGWSGGENPVPGMRVDVRFADGIEKMDTPSDLWGETESPSWWSNPYDPNDLIIAFRPALSPPAEGEVSVSDTEFQLEQARSLSGSKSETAIKALAWNLRVFQRRLDERRALATPTPAPVEKLADFMVPPDQAPSPVDHIGDATEKVDWQRVGPKLVEEIDPADMDAIGLWINEGEQPGLVPSGRIKALWQSVRAALAAARPGDAG